MEYNPYKCKACGNYPDTPQHYFLCEVPKVVPKDYKWHYRFLDLAKLVASWSKDPSTKCGAVIVRPDRTVASLGFNGFPKGCLDILYQDRELKYARMVHAEVNAILHTHEALHGYTMYTAQVPQIGHSCDRCTTCVIQAGITTIVTYKSDPPERWVESLARGLDMYKEAGVEVISVERN